MGRRQIFLHCHDSKVTKKKYFMTPENTNIRPYTNGHKQHCLNPIFQNLADINISGTMKNA
jgi:hypothetical protein